MNEIKSFFKNYANFEGRVTKREFFIPILSYMGAFFILMLLAIIFMLISTVLGVIIYVLLLLVNLGTLCPVLAVTARRLTAVGKNWALCFLLFAPFGFIPILIWASQDDVSE